jgi:hypothetical protein
MGALSTFRVRRLFQLLVLAFNVVGTVDLLGDYFNATRLGVPDMAGQLGATYVIPILYVPILMITHFAGFLLLAREAGEKASGSVERAAQERPIVEAQ